MSTKQPQWKRIANLGDANPIEYGGFFVYIDRTGTYEAEAELLVVDGEDRDHTTWTVYRFELDKCTFKNGILSDNPFHPDHAAWFAKPESERKNRPQDTTYLQNIADFQGVNISTLIKGFTSEDPIERAWAYRAVGEYHGFNNFDSYPVTYTKRSELPRRIRRGKK